MPAGTIGNINATTGGVTSPGYSPNGAASLTFTANFGSGPQPITLNLGNYGQPNGLTQYAGTSYTVDGLTQNGVPPGHYSGVTTQANGNVVVNYDNGQSRVVAQVPLTTFANPAALPRQDGPAFTARHRPGELGRQRRRRPTGRQRHGRLERGHRERVHPADRGPASLLR